LMATDIKLSCYYDKDNYSIGESIKLCIYLEFKRQKPLDVDKWYIETKGDEYFAPSRSYVQLHINSVDIKLTTYKSATIETLPSQLRIVLYDSNRNNQSSLCLGISMDRFTKALFEKTKRLNILLFGLAGSGKSSFINSCFTLFSNKVEQQIAEAGGNTQRVTKELKPYRMIAVHTSAPTSFGLVDTWGLEQNVDYYKQGQFECILQGTLPNGWQMSDEVTLDIISEGINMEKKIHCLIFFIPAGELVVQGKSFMVNKTREFCESATRMKVPFLVALTKIDIQVPAFRDNPMGQFPEIDKLIFHAAQTFGIAPNQVLPLINYWKETEKKFVLDKLLYKIISTAVSIAKNRCMPDDVRKLIESDW